MYSLEITSQDFRSTEHYLACAYISRHAHFGGIQKLYIYIVQYINILIDTNYRKEQMPNVSKSAIRLRILSEAVVLCTAAPFYVQYERQQTSMNHIKIDTLISLGLKIVLYIN